MASVLGQSSNPAEAGVTGVGDSFNGVRGISHGPNNGGVVGINDNQSDQAGPGVYGASKGTGVWGESTTWMGVYGKSESTTGGAGVMGEAGGSGNGVAGISQSGAGIYGRGGRVAGFFEGDVEVTGDIRLTGADCAENFDICSLTEAEPGTVMVLAEEGKLQVSELEYDHCVAGVVSGAGDFKPGIILDTLPSTTRRLPVALMGKVFCKVDAEYGAVRVGDLLTTSPTAGHAMKADNPQRAFGAVIGKALRPLSKGRGMIPILVALQ